MFNYHEGQEFEYYMKSRAEADARARAQALQQELDVARHSITTLQGRVGEM